MGKKIWSDLKDGDKVRVNSFSDGKDEATGISDIIEKELIKYFSLNDIAILVRAAFQTREFEERFIKIGLPYRVIGGMKFYERAEIKDHASPLHRSPDARPVPRPGVDSRSPSAAE